METNAMEVKNLSFSYGSNQILSDISLTIPRGKITTIMGANGCGKSTLFSLMTKNLTPGKGKILLEEKSIKKYSLSNLQEKCRSYTSIIPQQKISRSNASYRMEEPLIRKCWAEKVKKTSG